MNKQKLTTIGLVAVIAVLLGVAVGLNPQLFKGFLIYQPDQLTNKCDADCEALQNQVLSTYNSGAATQDVEGTNQQVLQGLYAVNEQCGCNGLKQIYIDGFDFTEVQAEQVLLSFGFDCSDHQYTNECLPVATLIEPKTCAEKVEYIVEEVNAGRVSEGDFKSFMNHFYTNGDSNGERCTCDQVYEILDRLDYSNDEAWTFIVQSDVIRCSGRPIPDNPGISIPTNPFNPTININPEDGPSLQPGGMMIDPGDDPIEAITPCENHRQNALDALGRYRSSSSSDDLADALEAMLLIDTDCCDFCSGATNNSGGYDGFY